MSDLKKYQGVIPAFYACYDEAGNISPDEVRALTDVPVTGVGGLSHPAFIEEQIASGRIDCAAMSRQLIADPDWPRKVASGEESSVRYCIRCNRDCLGGIQRHEGVHCVFDGDGGR